MNLQSRSFQIVIVYAVLLIGGLYAYAYADAWLPTIDPALLAVFGVCGALIAGVLGIMRLSRSAEGKKALWGVVIVVGVIVAYHLLTRPQVVLVTPLATHIAGS